MTVRLPDAMAAEIEAESRARNLSKSDIVRERIERTKPKVSSALADIADLIGSIDKGPGDVGARKKHYLRQGYGRKPYR
ncbi:MAG TPA: CopG family transcriptional regulator [Rhizomicrobium sp.]